MCLLVVLVITGEVLFHVVQAKITVMTDEHLWSVLMWKTLERLTEMIEENERNAES